MNSIVQKFRDYTNIILSSEKNQIKIDKEAPLSVALVFPKNTVFNIALLLVS